MNRMSAPSFGIFVVSLVLAILALLMMLGVIPAFIPAFWTLFIAWAVLTLGVLLKGM